MTDPRKEVVKIKLAKELERLAKIWADIQEEKRQQKCVGASHTFIHGTRCTCVTISKHAD